jgi:hypothetical protein
MENTIKSISTDLFYKIRSRFTGLTLGAPDGQVTINPEEAAFFDFDYMHGETPIGHVSISLAENGSMKVYYSDNLAEDMDPVQKNEWYDFLKELRVFAKSRLLSFDTRDIAKDNLDKNDFKFLSQNNAPVGESIMSEAAMYGTNKTSFQKLENTRLIIKHKSALPEEMTPGARSRNISALFVENGDGERFKYPFIHLAGARAMQRHVANGGAPYDDMGKSIVGMSEEIAQLRSFSNYVVRNDLMNSDTNGIVERSQGHLNKLRETLAKLAKQGHYQAYKESFQANIQEEIPEDVIADYTDKFTVKNFKEDIASVFPVIYRLMKEQSDVGYDDIVAMTSTEQMNSEEIEEDIEVTDFDKFESWVMGLGETSAIQDPDQRDAAILKLQELVGEAFPAGDNGLNAITSLKGIIDDPILEKEIELAVDKSKDSTFDVRELVHNWLEENAPDVLQELDFGDYAPEEQGETPATAPGGDITAPEAPAAVPAAAAEVPQESMGEEPGPVDVKELAEFIKSHYDKPSNTFATPPERIAIMVGKKFGEQAEQATRSWCEKLAPAQAVDNPEIQELARIKQLSGM